MKPTDRLLCWPIMHGSARVHVGPGRPELIEAAVRDAGGTVVPIDRAEAIVWVDPDAGTLPELPPDVRWVQLPGAGVDRWLDRVAASPTVVFTSAAGVYSRPVAEHALALLLAGARGLPRAARATSWEPGHGTSLDGTTVAIVGAGEIGGHLVRLLQPLNVDVLAVTRTGRAVAGARWSLPADRLDEIWPLADHVVLAAPATTATRHLVGAPQLQAMRSHAWLVNVARGTLVDTDALVAALRDDQLGGCALDVVDPEPLPAGHPLWGEPRALITPHVAARPRAPGSRLFAARVRENVERFLAGAPLLAPVDRDRGY
jgi:D-3-phosphoglycerate dehydrogenase